MDEDVYIRSGAVMHQSLTVARRPPNFSLMMANGSGTTKLDSRTEGTTCVALGPVCSSDFHLVETTVLFYIPRADVSDDEAS